uniref:Uncharacterized protein n=1 Tax=Rhizophora mucronata TaxID=61149 RepID=A0A2P2QFF0_RHIMU
MVGLMSKKFLSCVIKLLSPRTSTITTILPRKILLVIQFTVTA